MGASPPNPRSGLVLGLSALLLIGGSPAADEVFNAPAFGNATGGVRLGVSIAGENHPGRAIPVRVTIENGGTAELAVGAGAHLFAYDVTLVDDTGKKADRTLFYQRNKDKLFPTSGGITKIAPGGKSVDEIRLNVEYDTTLAGRYRLSVARTMNVGGKPQRVASAETTLDLTEEP